MKVQVQKSGFRLPGAVVCVLTALVCVTLHELGHVLAGLLTGCRITDFVILSAVPHVRLEGQCSAMQLAFQAAAGSLFFVGCWAMFLLVSKRGDHLLAIETSSFFVLVEMLGWLVSACLYPNSSEQNDAFDFLAASGTAPAEVIAATLAIALLGALLFTFRFRNVRTALTSVTHAKSVLSD